MILLYRGGGQLLCSAEVLLAVALLIVVIGHVARVERAGLVEEARFVGLASFHSVFIKMMWDRPVGSSR